jgi:hypothetical protein
MAQNIYAALHGERVSLGGTSGPLQARCYNSAVCRYRGDAGATHGEIAPGAGMHPARLICAECRHHLSWLGHAQLQAIAAAKGIHLTTARVVRCPVCDGPAPFEVVGGDVTHKCCGLWSTGGRPLASMGTWEARREALAAFAAFLNAEEMPRDHAYRLLSDQMQLSSGDRLISGLPENIARAVPAALGHIRERLGRRVNDGEVIDNG